MNRRRFLDYLSFQVDLVHRFYKVLTLRNPNFLVYRRVFFTISHFLSSATYFYFLFHLVTFSNLSTFAVL